MSGEPRPVSGAVGSRDLEPRVIHRPGELSAILDAERQKGASVGLVPTMGALHDGHRSLIEAAASQCSVVVVTIFVNPLQFDDPADLESYPRSLAFDVKLAASAGASLVFAPAVVDMYPDSPAPPASTVHVSGVSEPFEGASRPGHFDGVATVVAKLFAIVGRCRAYFGEKDFQQLVVVRQMARDLSFPVEIVPCPTVREPDGLAFSSRNARLSPEDRAAAVVLCRALDAGRRAIEGGERDPAVVRSLMVSEIGREPRAQLDYAEAVAAATLRTPHELSGDCRLLVAARLGAVRLIDNLAVQVPPEGLAQVRTKGAGSSGSQVHFGFDEGRKGRERKCVGA